MIIISVDWQFQRINELKQEKCLCTEQAIGWHDYHEGKKLDLERERSKQAELQRQHSRDEERQGGAPSAHTSALMLDPEELRSSDCPCSMVHAVDIFNFK